MALDIFDKGGLDIMSSSSSSGQYSPEQEIAALQILTQRYGYKQPKPKVSILERLANLLNKPRAFTAGIEQYGGISGGIRGMGENLDTAKIKEAELGRALTGKEKAEAIAEDIIKDPLTYLTFGTGAGVKLAGKTLTKAGAKALEKEGAKIGIDLAKAKFAEGLAKNLPEYSRYVDKGGLKVIAPGAGMLGVGDPIEIASKEAVQAPFKKVGEVVKSIPGVAPQLEAAKGLFGRAFVRNYDITQAVKKLRESGDANSIKLADKMEEYASNADKFEKGTAAMKEAAAKEMERLAKQFNPNEREQILHLIENKPKEGFVEGALPSTHNIPNPKLKAGAQFIEGVNKTIAKMEKSRGLLKDELENYIHRILTPEARKAVEAKGGMPGVSKIISTSIGSAGKHRSVGESILNAEEALKAQYGVQGDFYIKDPFVTTAVRQDISIGAQRSQDFLRQVMDSDIAKPAQMQKRYIKLQNGKTKVVEESKPFIDETGMEYVVPTNPDFKNAQVAVPKPIAEHIDRVYENLTNLSSLREFMGLYDKALNIWKGTVTGPFPAFHVRNLIGAIYNNWLAGIHSTKPYEEAGALLGAVKVAEKTTSMEAKLAAIKKLTDMKFKNAIGETITGDEMLRQYDNLVGRGTGRSADIAQDFTKRFSTSPKSLTDTVQDVGKGALETTEERVRLPLFIETWKKTGSFDDAAKTVFQFHFDYTPAGMTQLENQAMRRLIPFYRWTRGNIPLQIEQIIKQPGKQAGALRALRNMVDPNVREQLPEYMQQGLSMQIGPEKNGQVPILSGLGLPIEDVNKIPAPGNLDEIPNAMSPLIKYPIEAMTGHSFFYKKPIEELGSTFARYYKDYPGLRGYLDIKEVSKDGKTTYTGNPDKLYALQTMLGRYSTTLGKLSDQNVPQGVRQAQFFTGAQIKSVDLGQEKYYRATELQKAYEKQLRKAGIGKNFTRFYIPKGQKIRELE